MKQQIIKANIQGLKNTSTPQVKKDEGPVKKAKIPPQYAGRSRHVFDYLPSLEGCTSLDEVIKKCGMGFIAEKRPHNYPVYDESGGTEWVENPETVTIVRRDTQKYLGTTGVGYGVVQYEDVFGFTQVLADEDLAKFKNGGVTHDGAFGYIVMQSSESITLSPQESIDCYFYITTSHNMRTGLNIIPAPLWKGGNTVLVMPGISAMKFRHTKNVDARMAKAKKTIGAVKKYFADFEDSFKLLATVKLKDDLLETYLKSIFPDPKKNSTRTENIREKVTYTLLKDPAFRIPSLNQTMLGAYFAVCMYADHYMTVQKRKGKSELDAKIQTTLDTKGKGARRKAEAFASALKIQESFSGKDMMNV